MEEGLNIQSAGPLLSIIVPTREEEENIRPLVSRVQAALAGIEQEIIFVDDSDDRTPEVIGGLARQEPDQVILRHRVPGERDGGLSGAIIEGLKLARGSFVAVIDADLQHPPELLAEMMGRARSTGADVVIGSRYIPGGSAQGLGSGYRKAVSHATRWFSRVLFNNRIWSINDPLAGFFLFRRSLLEGVELRPIGYKILLEILMRTPWDKVEEVPYRFEARASGCTKATLQQGLTFFRHALRLFWEVPSAGRLWKFLAVGGSGVLVYLFILSLFHLGLAAPKAVAWLVAVESSICSNFLLNRGITWQDRRGPGRRGFLGDCVRYHGTTYIALAVNAATFWPLSWAGVPLGLAGLVSAAGSMANFVGSNQWVFVNRLPRPSVEPARFPRINRIKMGSAEQK